MHRTARPLAPLSTWVVVPTVSHHLLMLLMQVPFLEVDVVADDTRAAAGVAAAEWLAVTFGGGNPNASSTGTRTSDVDDGHFPGLEGRENGISPSSYLHTLPDDDDEDDQTSTLFFPLIMLLLVVAVAAKILMVLIVALPMLVCTTTHRATIMPTARRTPSKNSLAL